MQDGSEGVTSRGVINGVAETKRIAVQYVTKHVADDKIAVTIPEHTGDGKLHRGTGIAGETLKRKRNKSWLSSHASFHAGQTN